MEKMAPSSLVTAKTKQVIKVRDATEGIERAWQIASRMPYACYFTLPAPSLFFVSFEKRKKKKSRISIGSEAACERKEDFHKYTIRLTIAICCQVYCAHREDVHRY